MDAQLGDIHSQLVDREREIVQAVVDMAVACRSYLVEAADAIAELDVLLALAAAAVQNNYVRPTLADRAVFKIRGGRCAM
jgi:DNA mismatch repair protein MSH5